MSGSLTEATALTLTVAVPTFTMSSPGTLTVGTGSTNYEYVNIQRLYGFTGNVALSVSGLPNGVTASFNPNPVTTTSFSSDMVLQVSAAVVPGQYPVTITGVSGSQTVTASFSLVVVAPSFTLYGSGSTTVGQGESGTTYVYVNQLYGFTGAVTLSLSGLPSGVTASFATNPTSYYDSLTFNVGSGVPVGQYPLTITGVSGSLTQTTTMTLTVGTPSFTLSAYGLTVGQGQSSSTPIYVNEVNGFNSPVTVSVSGLPSGVTASFATNPTTSYFDSLTFNVGSSVPVGQYPLTITGVSGSLTQTTTMTLTVGVPSFTLSSYGLTIGQGQSFSTAVYVNGVNGFNSPVTMSVSGLPSGVTASFGTNPTTSYYNSLTFNVGSSVPVGQYPLTITGISGSLTQTTTITLTVGSPTFTLYGPYSVSLNQGGSSTNSYVYVSPQNGFTGGVTLSASGLPSGVTASFSPNPMTASSSMTLSATSTATPGTATVTIAGTSGSTATSIPVQVVVNANNFSLSAAPSEVFAVPGASGKSTINVVPINGFANSVNLSVSGLPAGVTATFSPATATTSSTLTFVVSSTAASGSSTVIVTGNSGTETASTPLLLNIQNSNATASSTTLTLTAGNNEVSTVTQGVLVTATANVSAGSTPVTTGQVYLCNGNATYCDLTHQIATAQLNGSGNATFRFVPGIGARTYKAVFAGTTTNVTSSSSPTSLTVTGSLPTTTTLTQSGTIGNYTLTATVTGQGGVAPSGDVSFIDTSSNNAKLANAAVVANSTTMTESVAQTIPTGANPFHMVSGDFNGDGIPDLALTSGSTSTVSILLGNSSGTFTTGTPLQISATPGLIALGDFNRDGNPDLAVVIPSNDTVAIYFGNGDGTFTPSTTPVYTLPQPNGLVVTDVNGDGLQDLVVLSSYTSSVTVLLGHGDGTFTPTTLSPAAGSSAQSIVQADFNADGVPDLAITNNWYTGSVTILMGNGDGSFTAAPTLSVAAYPYSIAVGDFNQDGKPDLAVGWNGSGVSVFPGNGDGTFAAAINAQTTGSAFALAVADLNGDGKQDLVVADPSNYKLTALLGNGDGTFTAGATEAMNAPESVVVGDWNGDGVPDLAAVNYYNSSVATVMTQLTQKVTATVSNINPGPGQQTINATYPGDSSYAASTSGTAILTGNKVTPNVTVTLSSSPISSNTPLTVSVGVTDSTNSGVPTGTITLTSGNYTSTAVQLASGSGNVFVPAGTLTLGMDTLTVNYTPDTSSASLYNAATGTATVSVDQTTPTITWPTPAAITYGTALSSTQLNATSATGGTFSYSPAAGTVLPAGQHQLSVTFTPTDTTNYQSSTSSVTLKVNQAPLNITANNVSRVYGMANPALAGTLGGAVNGDTFTEMFSTPATASSPSGTYAIVPLVSGANLANYSVTASNGTLTISPAPTTTTFTLSNQNMVLTATVASTSSGTPTGSVTFFAGQTSLGSATLSAGTANLTLTSFPTGDFSLSAQYAGDGNFAASTSASLPVLTFTASRTSLTVAASGSVTDNFSVTVPSGYAGTLQFSCTGLPQNTTCSFQPTSVSFSGTATTASTVLTLTTGAQARMDSVPFGNAEARAVRWAAMFTLPGLLPLFVSRRRLLRTRLHKILLSLLLCSVGAWFTGCGGGGSSTSKPSTPVTPSGNYTIQAVASGPSGVSQSTAVTVTVQ